MEKLLARIEMTKNEKNKMLLNFQEPVLTPVLVLNLTLLGKGTVKATKVMMELFLAIFTRPKHVKWVGPDKYEEITRPPPE